MKALQEAADEVRDDLRKNAKAEDLQALEDLKKAGMQVYVVPPEEIGAWQEATKGVWDLFIKENGALGQELVDICTKA